MSKRRITALDGLRGLAVLIVLIFHAAGGSKSPHRIVHWFGETVKAGWIGVTLFFVLSGFLITGILWDAKGEPHWWRNFYARRTVRIFPLYYLSLLLVLIAAAAAGTFHVAIRKIWSPALFLQNIHGPDASINDTGSPFFLFHFWSLAVEEQFYLIWPFLLLLVKSNKQALRLCAFVFFASALFRLVVWTSAPSPFFYTTLLFTRGGEMAAGAWLAIAYRDSLWPKLQRPTLWITLAGFAVFVATSFLSGSASEMSSLQMIVGLPAITIGFAGFLVLSLQEGAVTRAMNTRWLRWMGEISYGIYVYQILLAVVFSWITTRFTGLHEGSKYQAIHALVMTVGTLCIAQLSFLYFERPFLRLKRLFVVEPELKQR